VLSNLIDSYQHQHQPITAENSLTSVLSGSFASVGSSQFNNDGFLSDLDKLAMDHSMRLTDSLDIDSLAINSVRARLLSREWPSEDEFATRGRGIVLNNSNSSDSSSNSDIIEASASSSSSSSSSLTETILQNGTETKEDFISHLLTLHHSAKDSPLRNAAVHGDDTRQFEIQSEKLLTRNEYEEDLLKMKGINKVCMQNFDEDKLSKQAFEYSKVLSIRGTPTVFINGEKFEKLSQKNLINEIDRLLKE
jgi:hypothetical protein